jgi:hypothetical protein
MPMATFLFLVDGVISRFQVTQFITGDGSSRLPWPEEKKLEIMGGLYCERAFRVLF